MMRDVKLVKRPVEAAPIPKFDYDRMFQARMVKTLFQDQGFCLAVVDHLRAEHFEKRSHRWIVRHLLRYAAKYGAGASRVALKNALKRDLAHGKVKADLAVEIRAFLAKIRVPVKDRSYIKEELHTFIRHQAYREAILASIDSIEIGDYDQVDRNLAKALAIQNLAEGYGHFFVKDVHKRVEARTVVDKSGIPTGLEIDEYLRPGGVPEKGNCLACIVAPPGKGKSQVLVHIGKSAILSGKKVLHITLELSEEAIAERYDASFTGIEIGKLVEKSSKVERMVNDLSDSHGEFLHIKFFPALFLTTGKLKAYVRQLERIGFYPDMIIVDYAGEMRPSVSKDNTYQDLGDVYRELRALSAELHVPIWTAAQGNRSSLSKEEFSEEALADSLQPAMVCDLMIFFCQTDYEKKRGLGRLIIGNKNRLGPANVTTKITVDWSRSTIRKAS